VGGGGRYSQGNRGSAAGAWHKNETPWNVRKRSRDRQEALPRMENEQRWYRSLAVAALLRYLATANLRNPRMTSGPNINVRISVSWSVENTSIVFERVRTSSSSSRRLPECFRMELPLTMRCGPSRRLPSVLVRLAGAGAKLRQLTNRVPGPLKTLRGARTLACCIDTHVDVRPTPRRVSAQQTESARHGASSSALVG
jgi:hypothetical protein